VRLLVAAVLPALAGCWTSATPTATTPAARGFDRHVQTCALAPPAREAQQLIAERFVGHVGARSYLIASAPLGKLVLAWLDEAKLALTPLPLEAVDAAYEADGHLWLYGSRQLVDVDLTARPITITARPWNSAPHVTVTALAVSDRRVLLAGRETDQITFQLYDRANAALGVLTTVRSTTSIAPALRCTGEICFAIGIAGDGPSRRPFVERFDARGATQLELLGNEHVADLRTVRLGSRTVALWTSVQVAGLFARSVDASGHLDMPRVTLDGLPVAPVTFEVLGAVPARIATRGIDDLWTVGTLELDQHRIDDVRTLPLGVKMQFFAGAVTADGVLGAGFASTVDYQAGFHTWTASAQAAFLPSARGAEAEPAVDVLPGSFGDGRAGMGAFPLVEPGHAAVLVVPTGPDAAPGGELFTIRKPC
jgi:hypothetical protein